MNEEIIYPESLEQLLIEYFQGWYQGSGNESRIAALEPWEASAARNLLVAELSGISTSDLHEKRLHELKAFRFSVNAIIGELLAHMQKLADGKSGRMDTPSSWFPSALATHADVAGNIVSELNRDGYSISNLALNQEQLAKISGILANCTFSNKGKVRQVRTGSELAQLMSPALEAPLPGSNTYWLTDLNALALDREIFSLAFDPLLVSVVGDYFGCTPILVQTNAWFSFASNTSQKSLSENAQMYHQDKEFSKFLKVFIYLSDVGMEQGPHSYVIGSHHDELHSKGVDLSKRVSDEDLAKYYDPARIRTVVGPAGMVIFGDTSCVHKGLPVVKGYRAILQLEYSSSLYLSPVDAFDDVPEDLFKTLPYPEAVSRRLTSNYNSVLRQPSPEPSPPRKKPLLDRILAKLHLS